jgi:MoxR-like ATPase
MHSIFSQLQEKLSQHIVGQQDLIESLLIALLADGHILVEGAPGLAKTKAIQTLSEQLQGEFKRIQFTPDLLPADVTGSEIYRPQTQDFKFQSGPIFSDLVLADEINRAPAKVQSALLEAMSERQVTVGGKTHKLSDVFLVMATQNPIEQEGTYPLPEAQLDRFLMHVNVEFPDFDSEMKILKLVHGEQDQRVKNNSDDLQLTSQDILKARQQVLDVHMSEAVEKLIVQLTMITRQPHKHDDELANWLVCGVSPRATIALDRCSRAYAWLQGRDFVTPDDVFAMMMRVYRHRLLLDYRAVAQGVDAEKAIHRIAQLAAVL